MSATPDNTLADSEQLIADLRRRLAERDTELAEALEQRTATAEVLGVINSSPGDLAPAFDAILERALLLCDAAFGTLVSYDGELFRQVAQRPGELASLSRELRAQEGSLLHQLIEGKNFAAVDDIAATSRPSSLGGRAALIAAGAHSFLWVALRRENALVGAISIFRKEVRPFSEKEITLLQYFAAHAVGRKPACPSEELDPAGTSNSMNFRLTEQKSTLFQRLAVPL
jgi:GAF domain-containing protein